MNQSLTVNGRQYAWPVEPLVVVCIDGCQFEYITEAVAAGVAPFFGRLIASAVDAPANDAEGTCLMADCVVPSFTNPNNLSIVTGVPPSVHGICGNYFLDPDTGTEVMMNDPRYLRVGTILAGFADAGARVAVVTAKDKLRGLLGHELDGICFSAEKSDRTTRDDNGIDKVNRLLGLPVPSVYSAALSEFVFASADYLFRETPPDVMYLSTTDYIQHKVAPGDAVANRFYGMMDKYLSALDKQGARIVITADHGMHAKHNAQGQPNVVYLQDQLDGWLGAGLARVILPITDPYVVHHGALGSFALAYLPEVVDVESVVAKLLELPGIDAVHTREQASRLFELPPERIGDLVIVSATDTVLGGARAAHDLSGLDAPLRSHGGVSEQAVPLLANRRMSEANRTNTSDRQWRNFDAFDLGLNLLEPSTH